LSAAAQGEKDGSGVVLEVLDTSPGDETGEAVQVAELLQGWHRPIVTSFRDQGKSGSPAFFKVFREFGRKIHPLDFTKSRGVERSPWQGNREMRASGNGIRV
jgi:hypothetical protein